MSKQDEIIAEIQALPIVQQIRLGYLLAIESNSTANFKILQEEFETNLSPKLLDKMNDLADESLSMYFKILNRIFSELIAIIQDPFHQLELINQLLQEIQNSEYFQERVKQHPEALNSLYQASHAFINLQLAFIATNGQTFNSVPVNQQHQEASSQRQ